MIMKADDGKTFYINDVKSASHYSQDEINNILSAARNKYEYDCLIDRLYLYNQLPAKRKRNTKKTLQYSYLTARQEHYRRMHELSIQDVLFQK